MTEEEVYVGQRVRCIHRSHMNKEAIVLYRSPDVPDFWRVQFENGEIEGYHPKVLESMDTPLTVWLEKK